MKALHYISISNFKTEHHKTISLNLSYQTFGLPLHEAPIVLINHALTGNSNVTGKNGWWQSLVGEKKVVDTQRFAIIAFNIPGNGYDNLQFEDYKIFTAKDIAKLFALALKKLHITNLYAAIGGSLGGGIAWQLAALEPNLIQYLIPIASDWKSTDWVIANCYIQECILNHSVKPIEDARLHAMTLYRTPQSLSEKFQRSKATHKLFNVESWLHHHGEKLKARFQLSAYKTMNYLLKTIDITTQNKNLLDVAKGINSHIHIITINSDLFFKSEENWHTYVELKVVKENVSIGEIKSIHGHDAFLIEYQQLAKLLAPFFQQKSLENQKYQHRYVS